MIVTYKKDGQIITKRMSRKEAEKLSNAKNRTVIHTCWEKCPVELCNAASCPKVFDIDKKPIEEYDFINSGVQAYRESGEMAFFVVDDCDLYNKYEQENQGKQKVKIK